MEKSRVQQRAALQNGNGSTSTDAAHSPDDRYDISGFEPDPEVRSDLVEPEFADAHPADADDDGDGSAADAEKRQQKAREKRQKAPGRGRKDAQAPEPADAGNAAHEAPAPIPWGEFDPDAIVVDDEFRNLAPPQTESERALLEESLLAEGCRDPFVLWKDRLADGNNRYEICMQYSIPFSIIRLDFPDRDAVRHWIIRNQFARRNLNSFQRAEMVLAVEEAVAKEAELRMKAGKAADPPPDLAERGDTRDVLAEMAGISHGTLDKVRLLVRVGNEKVLKRLRNGETSIDREYKAIKRRLDGGESKPKGLRFTFASAPDAAKSDSLSAFGDFILGVLEKLDVGPEDAQAFLDSLGSRDTGREQ